MPPYDTIPVERQDVFGATITRLPDGMVRLWIVSGGDYAGPLVLNPAQAQQVGLEMIRVGVRAAS